MRGEFKPQMENMPLLNVILCKSEAFSRPKWKNATPKRHPTRHFVQIRGFFKLQMERDPLRSDNKNTLCSIPRLFQYPNGQTQLRNDPQDILLFKWVATRCPAAGRGRKCGTTQNTAGFEASAICSNPRQIHAYSARSNPRLIRDVLRP